MSHNNSMRGLMNCSYRADRGQPLTEKERRLLRRRGAIERSCQLRQYVHGILASEPVPVIRYGAYDLFARTIDGALHKDRAERHKRIADAVQMWTRTGSDERILVRILTDVFSLNPALARPPEPEAQSGNPAEGQ